MTEMEHGAPGGVPEVGGVEPEGYRAAMEGCALVERPPRAWITVTGRDPAGMLSGIATGTIPDRPTMRDEGGLRGQGFYSAVLTPKGRMITDLRIFPLVEGDPDFDAEAEHPGYLLDLPRTGLEGLQDHFRRFLPPRLARARDRSDAYGVLTVVGPDAAALVSREAFGLRLGAEELEALEEDEFLELDAGGGMRVRAVGCGDVEPPALDLLSDSGTISSLVDRLKGAGAVPAGPGVWDVLRVEAGRPAYGPDMDDSVIPVEAGIQDRAIDYGKGCYTGQEVVVMIRDRGQPPRQLRGLLLGDQPPPEPGTELFAPGRERAAGEIRTAVPSPGLGQTVALAYVRREVEVPGTVHVAGPDGPTAEVRELSGPGWGSAA